MLALATLGIHLKTGLPVIAVVRTLSRRSGAIGSSLGRHPTSFFFAPRHLSRCFNRVVGQVGRISSVLPQGVAHADKKDQNVAAVAGFPIKDVFACSPLKRRLFHFATLEKKVVLSVGRWVQSSQSRCSHESLPRNRWLHEE